MTSGGIVAVEGPSASGKSAASWAAGVLSGGATIPEAYVRLGRRVSLRYRSSADLVRIERHLFREDVRRWQQATQLRRRGRYVYLDTGILGTITYTWGLVRLRRAPERSLAALLTSFERAARDRRVGLPDRTAYIDTPGLVRRRRAMGDPEGHPEGLRALHDRVGALERELWLDRWKVLWGERLVRVDGRASVSQIAHRLHRLGSLPAPEPPRSRAEADRALLLTLLRSLRS
ncbi:MAG: hypothetical protein ABSA15_01305 [Thermoplasmata archaeon]|jgi:hypothetical protein